MLSTKYPFRNLRLNLYTSKQNLTLNNLQPLCNGYRHRKWTRRHEFKSWTKLIAFHIALGKGMNPIILPLAMGK